MNTIRWPRIDRSILRWHAWGILAGTVIGSLVTLRLYLMTDHPGTLPALLIGIPTLWLGCYAVASPLLLGLLVIWGRVARRHPHVEQTARARLLTLLFVGSLLAFAVHLLLVLFTVFQHRRTHHSSLALVWWTIKNSGPMFGLFWIAAVAWLVLPRIWLSVVFAAPNPRTTARVDRASGTPLERPAERA